MRLNQILPVSIQYIRLQPASEGNPAAACARLQPEVYLSIMPQRFKMSKSGGRCGNRLAVNQRGFSKCNRNAEALLRNLTQNFQLHSAHHADGNFLRFLVPLHL